MNKILYVIGIITAMSLIFAASCSKKEEARKAESRAQAAETLPEVSEPAPAPEPAAAPTEVQAEVQIETAEATVEESAPVPALAPARAAPAAPAPPPAAAPRFAVESISGPRQVAVGQEFTLTAAVRGNAVSTGYIWRAKIGGETLVEGTTPEPRVLLRLDKTGEALITCEALGGGGGVLASRTIRLNVADAAPRQADPAAAADSKLIIEHIAGPKQAYAGQELTLKCSVVGVGNITGYVWRFQNGGDVIERKTREPQVKVTLDKIGNYAITCDVAEAGKTLASQHFNIRIVSSLLSVNAGGPYNAMMNKPAKLLGNAAAKTGKIALYEWFLSGGEKPDWSGAENAVVQYSFNKSGERRAAFRVTLADGTSVSDTAIVYVGSMKPVANAGPDAVSYPNRKAKLNGTGRSPDGSIVKYEWDFDGDGVFDWSSAKTGAASYTFKTFSYPIFRVTDTEGNTAVDTARVVVCPGDMVTVERGKFCADKYEWPNRRGGTPATNVSWEEAAKACEGAGKRLCTSDEWQRACRNDNSLNEAGPNVFPYGNEFDNEKCNTLGNPGTQNKLSPSGSLGACAGAVGAFDMSGNAAEWAAAPDGSARAHGGFYQSGPDAGNCDSYVTLEHSRKYLYVGFRCCK